MTKISVACLDPGRLPIYNIDTLVTHWRAYGFRVNVGKGFDEDADIGILHLDRSIITPEMMPYVPKGLRVLNGSVRDITKRHLGTLEVRRGDGWDGQVIVKSNLNHYGAPERLGQPKTKAVRNRDRIAEISWRSARQLPFQRYPVLDHPHLVPGWVWDNPDFIVERLMTERVDGLYVVRSVLFLGEQMMGWWMLSDNPDVRISTSRRIEILTDLPVEIQDLRKALGFDYGKFDFVLRDGRPVVFDFNKTPAAHLLGMGPGLRNVSLGLYDLLG